MRSLLTFCALVLCASSPLAGGAEISGLIDDCVDRLAVIEASPDATKAELKERKALAKIRTSLVLAVSLLDQDSDGGEPKALAKGLKALAKVAKSWAKLNSPDPDLSPGALEALGAEFEFRATIWSEEVIRIVGALEGKSLAKIEKLRATGEATLAAARNLWPTDRARSAKAYAKAVSTLRKAAVIGGPLVPFVPLVHIHSGLAGAASSVLGASDSPDTALEELSREIATVAEDPSAVDAGAEEVEASLLEAMQGPADLEALRTACESSTRSYYPAPVPETSTTKTVRKEGDPAAPDTVVIYVNGIWNTHGKFFNGLSTLASSIRIHRPQVAPKIEIAGFWNRTGLVDPTTLQACEWQAERGGILGLPGGAQVLEQVREVRPELYRHFMALEEARRDARARACVEDIPDWAADLLETMTQWRDAVGEELPDPAQVADLREVIRSHVQVGRKVVLVGHSQGNLFIRQALEGLGSDGRGDYLDSVGVVAVSSPDPYTASDSYGAFESHMLEGDFTSLLSGLDENRSNLWSDALAGTNCFLFPVHCAYFLAGTHGFASSYLRFRSSRDPILSSITEMQRDLSNPRVLGPGWVRRAVGFGGDILPHVAAYTDGSTITGGAFGASVIFEPGDINETHLTGTGGFLARYSAAGEFLWAAKVPLFLSLRGLADGGVAICGELEGTVTFGTGELNETTLVTAGASDVFVARYDANGALLWARSAGGDGADIAYGLAAREDGSVLVTGSVSSGAVFGGGEATQTTILTGGSKIAFLAWYDADGGFSRVRTAPGTGTGLGSTVSVAPDGTLYLAGTLSAGAVVTFGEGEEQETVVSADTLREDLFLASYLPGGQLRWVRAIRGRFWDGYGPFVRTATLPDGSCAVSGHLIGDAVIEEDDGSVYRVPTSDHRLSFVLSRFSSRGELLWAKGVGGLADSWIGTEAFAGSLVGMLDSSVAVVGMVERYAAFGRGEQNETVLMNSGEQVAYLARFEPDGSLRYARSLGVEGRSLALSAARIFDGSLLIEGFYGDSGDEECILDTGRGGGEVRLGGAEDLGHFLLRFSE